jgi:hypothetical protein
MRSRPRLGAANAALIALYFVPVWGAEAVRALTSPFYGFDDPMHAAAASYVRGVFDFGLPGLLRASIVLATIKLIAAAAFLACVIDFARALLVRREVDRVTLETALALAGGGVLLLALPILGTGDGGLIRLHATELLLVVGAITVLSVERHVEERAARPPPAAEPGAAGRPIRAAP